MFYNIQIEKVDENYNTMLTAQSRVTSEMIAECKDIDVLELTMIKTLELFRAKENSINQKIEIKIIQKNIK
jgi:hypothetical protein